MQRMTRSFRFVVALVLIAAMPALLAAQQAPAAPSAESRSQAQVQAFENSLLGAINSAAGQLHTRVREALPNIPVRLQYETSPIVTGVVLPDAGAVFHVLIPAISDIDLVMTRAWLERERQRKNPLVPATTGPGRVANSTLVTDDPTTAPLLTEPDKEYTTLVKQALIDAVVDHALSLPIPAGQYLTVIADELQTQPASPFEPRSRSLILQLKGEDLIAFRENRITRDE